MCLVNKTRAAADKLQNLSELAFKSPVPSIYLFIAQLRQYIKHGVPDDMRGQVWKKLIGNQAMKVMSSFNYQVTLSLVHTGKLVWKILK